MIWPVRKPPLPPLLDSSHHQAHPAKRGSEFVQRHALSLSRRHPLRHSPRGQQFARSQHEPLPKSDLPLLLAHLPSPHEPPSLLLPSSFPHLCTKLTYSVRRVVRLRIDIQ